MRSAELRLGLAGAAAVLLLSGCATTQQTSARAKLQAERLLASRQRVLVTRESPSVRVERVSLLRGRSRTAVAVLLRNGGPRAVSDLPISVGVGGRYLNRRGGLPYFQTHAPALAPGREATWVFVTRAPVRGGGRPFARVGSRPAVDSGASRLPSLRATLGPRPGTATLMNSSSLPQYGVDVYADARRGSRLVAAGRTAVPRIGPGASVTVRLSLIGRAAGAPLHIEAAPTIFK